MKNYDVNEDVSNKCDKVWKGLLENKEILKQRDPKVFILGGQPGAGNSPFGKSNVRFSLNFYI